MNRWALLPILALAACPPPQPVPPKPTTADCGSACDNLVRLHCPEGNGQCIATCEHLIAEPITLWSSKCVSEAPTIETVRMCPAVRCQQ